MKYLKLFKLDSDYQAFIGGEEFITPNVSYTLDNKISYFNSGNIIPSEPDDSKKYLTFTAIEDSTIVLKQVTMDGNISSPNNTNLSYSIDGQPWEIWDFNNPISLNMNQSVRLKGHNENGFSNIDITTGQGYILTFSFSTGKLNISGNIMSLLYGDDFVGKNDLTGKVGAFFGLFGDIYGMSTGSVNEKTYIIDAKDLILPATTLAEFCYGFMFLGCTSLTSAPALPATTLADGCYIFMFAGCESLTTAPALPATTLVNGCYQNMFAGCTSLNHIKMLATNINGNGCFDSWVSDVSQTGTFVKHASLNIYDYNIIPDGDWVVETYIPNHIINGWTELYPNVEELNIVNNSDTDIIIDFTNGDESFDLNAHTKIDMTFDEFVNSKFSHEFVFDVLYLNTDNNTKCVIKDIVYRSDYYNIGDLLEEYTSKYNIQYTEVFSIVIKNVANSNLLPNGWNDLYESVKPFTIVNKTNDVLYLDNGNDDIYIYPDEAYNFYNVSTNSFSHSGDFKLDGLLSNNNENIVVLSEYWNSNETLLDAIIRINSNYNNIINNYNEYSLVIYKTQTQAPV